MMATTLNFLKEKVQGNTNIETLEACIAELETMQGEIQQLLDSRGKLERGRTATRDQLRDVLAQRSEKLARALSALAAREDLPELAAQVEFSASKLRYGRLNVLSQRYHLIAEMAQQHSEKLPAYGQSQEDIDTFVNQLNAFREIINAPRERIAARKALNAQLYKKIDEAATLINDQLDGLVFQLDVEELYNEYLTHRILVDPATRSRVASIEEMDDGEVDDSYLV